MGLLDSKQQSAAALVLLRDRDEDPGVDPAPGGVEVFLVRRHIQSDFAPDVFVFPGGTVKPEDRMLEADMSSPTQHDGPTALGSGFRAAAIRECFDPEIPLNIYDLGLIYGIDIDQSAIAVKMTLTSEGCPSARTIPEDVRRKIAALGQPNVTVDVVWDPPWHPSRISPDGKQKLGLG